MAAGESGDHLRAEPERAAETDIMAEVVKVQKSIADEGAQLALEIVEFIGKNT